MLQAAPLDGLNGLLNYGAIGLVLAWMLWRSDGRLEKIERSLDRLSRAQLLTLIARSDVDEPIKRQAHQLLRELTPHAVEDEDAGA